MALSTKPPMYDKHDPEGTIRNICLYLERLQEELDFTLKQLQKALKEK